MTVGNIHTNLHAGLTLRMGQDLDNDYGPPRVAPPLPGRAISPRATISAGTSSLALRVELWPTTSFSTGASFATRIPVYRATRSSPICKRDSSCRSCRHRSRSHMLSVLKSSRNRPIRNASARLVFQGSFDVRSHL
ncbi:MAG: DUF2219 family protein [Hyphomonadaceae bacterium]|nr:DUF2219 family protein [Hyphomonadaceae bacterium]